MPGKSPAIGMAISPPHQRHQLHEAYARIVAERDPLVERLGLAVVDEDEEAVALECLAGAVELFLPVDLPRPLEPRPARGAGVGLGAGRGDESAENELVLLPVALVI